MAVNLVIVESASKAKTIQKYLNDAPELRHLGTFRVMASLGHIVDLPAKEMAVDTTTWAVSYETIKAKYKTVKALKDACKTSTRVFLASDPDREGASIAKHLQRVLKLPSNVPRLMFHEITPRALVQAVLHPTTIDEKLVAAQETRRILDRVVGYELSPLLWRRFSTSSLSAGRVQSAALKLLVDRTVAQEAHVPEPYWLLHAAWEAPNGDIIETRAYGPNANLQTFTEPDVLAALQSLQKQAKTCTQTPASATFSKKETSKTPPAPFVTSSLQQEAYARYGIPAKRTMQLAQGLYEAGHITYMRTDSLTISKDAQTAILSHISNTYGPTWAQARSYKTKTLAAQEAHEAIRPTHPEVATLEPTEAITTQHIKLYTLIHARTVASQMIQAKYAEVTATVRPSNSDLEFRGVHTILTHPGYLRVYSPDKVPDAAALAKWDVFFSQPTTPVTARSFKAEGDVTRPPSQYNEPLLVKALEKHGIGRPSTFATIVDKLLTKNYVCKGANPQSTHEVRHYTCAPAVPDSPITTTTEAVLIGGKDADRMLPTNLGRRVNEYLIGITPYLLDTMFTSGMEADLDKIARGDADNKAVLNAFYEQFHNSVGQASQTQKEKAAEPEKAKATKKTKKTNKDAKDTKDTKDARPPAPASLRDFAGLETSVVQTRFGLALFHAPTSKFISLGPFIEWRNTTVQDMTTKDVRFLQALPITRPDRTQVAIGRYGLYIKDQAGKNQRLPRIEWDAIYEEFE